MPFKTFTASVLSSSDVNTYLMKQAVITCTSSTRPASPVQGMTIYETDTNRRATYNGTAWVYDGGVSAYTPTPTNMTVGNGTLLGRWSQIGNTVNLRISLTAGSTTTYTATGVTFALPTPAVSSLGEQSLSLKIYNGAANFTGFGLITAGASTITAFVPTTTTSTTYAGMSSGTVTAGTAGNMVIVGWYEVP